MGYRQPKTKSRNDGKAALNLANEHISLEELLANEIVTKVRTGSLQTEDKSNDAKGIVITLAEKYPIQLTQDDRLIIYEKGDLHFAHKPKVTIKLRRMDATALVNVLKKI